ncbi:MAG: hypothetical protein QOD07_1633 [Frankiaceae bacterium]|jgi:hypothetical protein|nr:hypothetical protein [Frankiaceae bacterium]
MRRRIGVSVALVMLITSVCLSTGASAQAQFSTRRLGVSSHELQVLAGSPMRVTGHRVESTRSGVFDVYALTPTPPLKGEWVMVVRLGPTRAVVAVVRDRRGVVSLVDHDRVVRTGQASFATSAVGCGDASDALDAVDRACENAPPPTPYTAAACEAAKAASYAVTAVCAIVDLPPGANGPFTIDAAPVNCYGTGPTKCTWGGRIHVGDSPVSASDNMYSCYGQLGAAATGTWNGPCFEHYIYFFCGGTCQLGPGDYVFGFADSNAPTGAGDLSLATGFGPPWGEFVGSKCGLSAADDPDGGCAKLASSWGFPLHAD